MSSINEVMEEERSAQRLVRDAEERAETVVSDAKAAAAAMVSKAQTDDTILKELEQRQKERTSAERAEIFRDCQGRVEEAERRSQKNFETAVNLIVESVLGEGNE